MIILRRLLYFLALVGVVVLNFIYVDYQFMLVLIILVAVLAADYILYRLNMRKIQAVADETNECYTVGDRINMTLVFCKKFLKKSDKSKNSVDGKSSLLCIPARKCTVEQRYSNDDGSAPKIFEIKPTGGRFRLKFTAEHVGIADICLDKLAVTDYCGMFSKNTVCGYEKKIVIYPQIIDLNETQSSLIKDIELIKQSFYETDNTEVVDLREYQQGDSLGRIHWKKSSVGEEYVVKQFGDTMKCTVRIVVDLDVSGNDRFLLDKIYAWSLSVGLLCVENDMTGEFITWDSQYSDYVSLAFSTTDEAYEAMKKLFEIKAEKDSFEKLENMLAADGVLGDTQMILVTAKNYSDSRFATVRVTE